MLLILSKHEYQNQLHFAMHGIIDCARKKKRVERHIKKTSIGECNAAAHGAESVLHTFRSG